MATRPRSRAKSRRGGDTENAPASRPRTRSSGSSRGRSRAQSKKNVQAGIRPNADGKYPVTCPRCAASYKVPEAYLDQAVTCKHCKTAFTPRHALGHGQRSKGKRGGPPKGVLQLALFGVLVLLVVIIYNNVVENEKPEIVSTADTRRFLETRSEPFQAWQKLCLGVQKKDRQAVGTALAWEVVWEANKKKSDGSWALTPSDQKLAFKESYATELFKGSPPPAPEEPGKRPPPIPWTLARAFELCEAEWFKFDQAVLWPVDVKHLDFDVRYSSRDRPALTAAEGQISVHVIETNGNWKVKSWEIKHLPSPARKKRKKIRHKTIKAPKWEEVTIKGQKLKTYQGEVVPVPHEDGTPLDLRREIDKVIDTVFTPNEDDPKAASVASMRLLDIGKPAVCRILNAFYERRPKTRFDIEAFNILMKAFNNLAGASIDFLPDPDPQSSFGGTDKDREILVKAAFGHWYWNFWKKEQDLTGETDDALDKAMQEGPKKDAGRKK